LHQGRVDFSLLFYTVTKFRKPRHSHVISWSISALRLDRVGPLKDVRRWPTNILTRLLDLCLYIELYTVFWLLC
jgi:hypothetical protein